MKRAIAVPVIGAIVILILVSAYIYLSPPPKTKPALEKLCEYIHQNLNLECPRILGDETLYALGDAIPPTQPPMSGDLSDITLRPPVDVPISHLLSSTCLVKGSHLSVRPQAPSAVTLPDITYSVEKSWTGKAAFEIPELHGLKVDPGAHAGKLSSVTLQFGKAHSELLDENDVLQALTSCEIKKACTDNVRLSADRIINRVVVAEGVQYQFLDNDNKVISVDTALKEDIIKFDASQESASNWRQSSTLSSLTPLVIGVGFLDPRVLQQHTLCQEAVVVRASGRSTVTISGGGGVGNIGDPQSVSAGLGDEARLERKGTEASECSASFERTVSEGRATAIIRTPTQYSFVFDYSVYAQGGHYATAAQCPGGIVIGKTGHDNTTLAVVSMAGTLRATVRSDYAKLGIRWDGLPPGSQLRITDPNGNLVQLDKSEKEGESPPPSQVNGYFVLPTVGNSAFHTEQPGVYLVDIAIDTSESAAGAGIKSQSHQGHIELNY
jgi:hypothetical protein